jgi:O-antigen/teichoic acid export membrane protein
MLALTMGTNVLMAGLALVSSLLAARLLGPIGRGELAAIQTWPMLLAALMPLGVPEALIYFSAREPQRAGRWLTTAIGVALVSCVPFALVGYLLMPRLLSAQSDAVVNAARVYLWILPIQAVVGMLPHPLRGRQDLLFWNIVRPLANLVWIGVLTLHILLHMNDPVSISEKNLIALVLLAVPLGLIIIRRIQSPFRPSISLAPPLLRFGGPLVLSTLPSMLNLRLDQLLMAGFLGSRQLGFYVVGVAWSSAVAPLVTAVGITLLPRVAAVQPEMQASLLAQSTRLGMFLAIFSGIITAVAAPISIPLLYGADFAPAIPVAIILSLAGGVSAFNQVLDAGALALARPRFVLFAESSGLIATLGLLWLLLPSLQLIGAALASFVSYTIVSLVLIRCIRQQTGLPLRILLVPMHEDFAALASRLGMGRKHLGLDTQGGGRGTAS